MAFECDVRTQVGHPRLQAEQNTTVQSLPDDLGAENQNAIPGPHRLMALLAGLSLQLTASAFELTRIAPAAAGRFAQTNVTSLFRNQNHH